jgi:hypothetical protein
MAQIPGQQADIGNSANYKYVILEASATPAQVASYHAANPNTKVLIYENSSFINGDCQYYPYTNSPMDLCQAQDGNTDWLIESGGKPIPSEFGDLYWANIANASYQSTWLADATSVVKTLGADGIFMDDTNTYVGHNEEGTLPGYNDTTYAAAELSFLKYEYAGLHAEGLLNVPNVAVDNGDSTQESVLESMAPYATAIFQEMYMNYNFDGTGQAGETDLFSGQAWLNWINQEIAVGKVGNYYANTYGNTTTNTQVMTYGKASFLLGWNGDAGSAYQWNYEDGTDNFVNPYNKAWAADVGSPTDSYSQMSDGLYTRSFTDGIVLVNSNASGSVTYNLGKTYTNAVTGAQVTSVTLGPTTAMILSND